MLKLSPQSQDLFWLDLLSAPGVRVRMRPITPVAMLVARQAVGKMMAAEHDDAEDEEPGDTIIRGGVELTMNLAHFGIAEWEGVGDENGDVTPVTPERIDQLLAIWPIYSEIDERYVTPALVVSAEKNGSSNAPNGTSAEAPSTAEGAQS